MPEESLIRTLLLPELSFVSFRKVPDTRIIEELVEGRTGAELEAALSSIPGRENVRTVAIDMCDPFKSFVKNFFPNATIVADKFHVLRLLTPVPPTG